MIVLISDIHLTDESTSGNVHTTAFELLESEIIGTIENKKDIKELRIVLLGDIVDLVRTDYWLRENIPPEHRPWNGDIDPSTGMNSDMVMVEKQFNEILSRILATPAGTAFFAMLDTVAMKARDCGVESTGVTYVVGNHDRPLNNFESLRNRLRNSCKADTYMEFASVFYDPEYSVLARHGCEWDTVCYSWKFSNKVYNTHYDQFDEPVCRIMSLGEVITAELMSGIVYHVRETLGNNPSNQDTEFIETIKEVNNLRPMVDVFRYLDWLVKNGMSGYDEVLRGALRKALEATYASGLAMRWRKYNCTTLFLLKYADSQLIHGFGFVKLLVSWIHVILNAWERIQYIFSGSDDDLIAGVPQEWKNKDHENVQYVVYGHTHEARHDYFKGERNGTVRLYINTGTYLPLIQECRKENGYSTAFQMTMAYIFKGSEDRDGKKDAMPSLEIWNGIKRKNYV